MDYVLFVECFGICVTVYVYRIFVSLFSFIRSYSYGFCIFFFQSIAFPLWTRMFYIWLVRRVHVLQLFRHNTVSLVVLVVFAFTTFNLCTNAIVLPMNKRIFLNGAHGGLYVTFQPLCWRRSERWTYTAVPQYISLT